MPGESWAGRLLVATPGLTDPNFERSVVLLVSHDSTGALGVVLNRATEVTVSDVLPDGWQILAAEPAVVFEGGPVQPEAALCLGRTKPGQKTVPDGFHRVDGMVGTVDLSGDPTRLLGCVNEVRVFAGYAGWSAGQLETEVKAGGWFLFDALPGDAFMTRPDDLWQMVLRRQGGIIAAVAVFPSDPILN
jgi:putative transcriptional regulator